MRYLISYDLDKPGQNYPAIITTLEKWGAKRVLYSQWVIRLTGTSAKQVATTLWSVMDSNDRLLVSCLDSADWWSFRLIVDPNTI